MPARKRYIRPAFLKQRRGRGAAKHTRARVGKPASKNLVQFKKSGRTFSVRIEGTAAYLAAIAGAGAGLAYIVHICL